MLRQDFVTPGQLVSGRNVREDSYQGRQRRRTCGRGVITMNAYIPREQDGSHAVNEALQHLHLRTHTLHARCLVTLFQF